MILLVINKKNQNVFCVFSKITKPWTLQEKGVDSLICWKDKFASVSWLEIKVSQRLMSRTQRKLRFTVLRLHILMKSWYYKMLKIAFYQALVRLNTADFYRKSKKRKASTGTFFEIERVVSKRVKKGKVSDCFDTAFVPHTACDRSFCLNLPVASLIVI